jgi:hypothetical protein
VPKRRIPNIPGIVTFETEDSISRNAVDDAASLLETFKDKERSEDHAVNHLMSDCGWSLMVSVLAVHVAQLERSLEEAIRIQRRTVGLPGEPAKPSKPTLDDGDEIPF